jgi:hypothetical protein
MSSTTIVNEDTTTTKVIGTVRVILQYSCGVGRLHPEAKSTWTTAGQRNHVFVTPEPIHLSDIFPAQTIVPAFEFPSQHSHSNLSHYDMVFVYGDSLMQQLVANRFVPLVTSQQKNRRSRYFRHKVCNVKKSKVI